MEKLLCAISRCLIGDNVRYDGREKSNPLILQTLSPCADWLAVCPEVEIGLSVPRPPIHLICRNNEIRAVFVHDETKDFTERLRQHVFAMQKRLANVDGFIFKARSPSCGIGSVPLVGQAVLTNGLFADQVQKIFPELPMVDEEQLMDKNKRDLFIKSMYDYRNSKAGWNM